MTKKVNPYLYLIASVPVLLGVVFAMLLGLVSLPALLCFGLSVVSLLFVWAYNFRNEKKYSGKNNYYGELISKKENEYKEYLEIEAKYAGKIDKFLNGFEMGTVRNRYSALMDLSKWVVEYETLEKRREQIERELKSFELEKFAEQPALELSLNSLQKEKEIVQQTLNDKVKENARKKANIKYDEDIVVALSDLENEKVSLKEKEKIYKDEYDILRLTAEFLKKADENLKIKYREPLQNSLNKYLSYISNINKKVKIDIDMSITVEESGVEKVTDFYSKGYQNLFEICKRFALTDVLFKGEKPFIILDDPFYNLDDEKIASSLSLIKRLSEEYQIIYFVCHESRRA